MREEKTFEFSTTNCLNPEDVFPPNLEYTFDVISLYRLHPKWDSDSIPAHQEVKGSEASKPTVVAIRLEGLATGRRVGRRSPSALSLSLSLLLVTLALT
ncbi:unnamed protein product [Protopolystoma xenopodis]|uniref:Uncharacterized protein n=1 Tax=Protopolystoma xenopodis TaxID=117903 RepID=A0A3S5AM81_9PLAT|nr:unnamed protein product [Protopolystoma xenopodis]